MKLAAMALVGLMMCGCGASQRSAVGIDPDSEVVNNYIATHGYPDQYSGNITYGHCDTKDECAIPVTLNGSHWDGYQAVSDKWELSGKYIKSTSLTIRGIDSSIPALICDLQDGQWGDSGYTLHECKLGEGHTLDEVMTIIIRQMQTEDRRHRDEVEAIYSDLYRIQSDKTIKKHNAKVSVTK